MTKRQDPESADAQRVTQLLEGWVDRREERKLLALLADLPAGRLNAVLESIDPARLFDAVDNRVVGPDNRAALIELLAYRRAPELTVHATAAVIFGMQAGRTTPRMERAIRDLLLRWGGTELTRLKNLIGDRTDRHDLEGLVYGDISDAAVRAEIIAHFAAERAAEAIDEVKVLCDIDDTVFCRLHDSRFPRGIVYPGVLALLEALDQGPHDQPFSTGDLTFVTARPADAFGLIEGHSRRALRKAGIADLDLLGGTLGALLTKEAMAERKLLNIKHYCAMFPEYRVMFIGDSGQGDPLVGERIRHQHEDVAAVLIHDVVGTGGAERARKAALDVVYFDTYVGAALEARDRGLLSNQGLHSVVAETRVGMAAVPWTSEAQRTEMQALVDRDVGRAVTRYPLSASG